jgi:hypothetical protein
VPRETDATEAAFASSAVAPVDSASSSMVAAAGSCSPSVVLHVDLRVQARRPARCRGSSSRTATCRGEEPTPPIWI